MKRITPHQPRNSLSREAKTGGTQLVPISKSTSAGKARVARTFIDLFAGIGGFRLALERQGFKCVYSSEIDPFARQTYEANFGKEQLFGDIRTDKSKVPSHTLLAAGFPCQPFSLAGVSKRNSLKVPHGFNDRVSGTLFFEIASILEARKPDAFLLENVRNLERHDNRRTFQEIIRTLEDELKYTVSYRVIDASRFLPQHRPRIYIVGFREQNDFSFDNLDIPKSPKSLKSVLIPNSKVSDKYTLSTKLWTYLKKYKRKHRKAGNGFGFGLVSRDLDTRTRTLSARYHKDGSEILISRGPRRNPRRLTPRECARLMGFPDDFKIPVSDTQAYRQFGNSVAVPVIESIAREIRRCLQ